MFLSASIRRIPRVGNGRLASRRLRVALLAAIASLLALSLRAQSPSAVPGVRDSAVPSSGSKNARQAYDEGQRAESLGDWETAFQAYQQAATLSPDDRAIQAKAILARSALAQQRTEQAERQLVSGNRVLARAMLQSAVQVDPTYTVARERLQELA